ncbi:Lacal_2735 family protein [Pontimicrobium sp. IMCC45349]|uniref:Lacal_2735 family protein n=1 Tax=Pontimicrobium sp. IMCC45349 TaxID=3391574 RepID=UPI0039A376BE
MKKNTNIKQHRDKLRKKYKLLIEEAYNLRQTDHALSDFSEYRAMQLLNRMNRLKFLDRDFKVVS